jgi:pyruvate,water dikinase
MATLVPLDEFATGEWYPGFKPEFLEMPYIVDPTGPFKKGDEEALWFLDFHWSRGLTPLAVHTWAGDGYCWGTQYAAESLPLPPGRGVTTRFAGTHLYGSAIPETDPQQLASRGARIAHNLPAYLQDYPGFWDRGRVELESWWDYFRGIDYSAQSLNDLHTLLHHARHYHKRGMEIHFGVMYPLLANFVAFYSQCVEFGIEPGEVGKFLQGWDTKIMETDRELSKLSASARAKGLGEAFAAHEPEKLRAGLSAHGGAASAWLTEFDDFLGYYGYRAEGTTDPALPSWIEDPTPPLGMIQSFLAKPGEHDYEAAARAAVQEREAAIATARAKLTAEEQATFDAGLASNQAANFPFWQDDHNFYMDLKIMLPLRWTCQELASRVGADDSGDMLYLFWPELLDVAAGATYNGELRSLVDARKQYFAHWQARRGEMPKVLGTVPESVEDPILIEIFGLNAHSLKAMQSPGDAETVTGIAASKGTARGTARVLHDADELHRVAPGEILVCESTSPNWTPAFAKIAACVCDGGGTLSHAAIVGREYGIPVVTASGIATTAISDGDEIEVDGTTGNVTVLTRAPAGASQ